MNKSFQIGKIGTREGDCNFITFGLNVRLKLCLRDVSDFPGVRMLRYNSDNFNVGVQSFVIYSKWGGKFNCWRLFNPGSRKVQVHKRKRFEERKLREEEA